MYAQDNPRNKILMLKDFLLASTIKSSSRIQL